MFAAYALPTNGQKRKNKKPLKPLCLNGFRGLGERIRTSGLLNPMGRFGEQVPRVHRRVRAVQASTLPNSAHPSPFIKKHLFLLLFKK